MTKPFDPVKSALQGRDVIEYLDTHFKGKGRTLFIGNVGFSADAVFCASRLAGVPNVDFRFIFERRPDVPHQVDELAKAREDELRQLLGARLVIEPIDVCASDGAPLAGRHTCVLTDRWLKSAEYTDVVVDATGMSRSTCFPVVKQMVDHSRALKIRVHLVVADSDGNGSLGIESVSGERGDWIHGFQSDIETDAKSGALRLWVVQLKEGAGPVLNRLFTDLKTPNEVCPIVPFPAGRVPTRGDRLLFDLRDRWIDDWGESPLSLIYADESDPTDVFRAIGELHAARQDSLRGAVDSVTILSPLGRRLPSIGMLLAAQKYELPLYYLETVGYKVTGPVKLACGTQPDHLWCFRFLPS